MKLILPLWLWNVAGDSYLQELLLTLRWSNFSLFYFIFSLFQVGQHLSWKRRIFCLIKYVIWWIFVLGPTDLLTSCSVMHAGCWAPRMNKLHGQKWVSYEIGMNILSEVVSSISSVPNQQGAGALDLTPSVSMSSDKIMINLWSHKFGC